MLRSPEFLAKLAKQNIKLHLVDDDADYKKRIETLQKGETPLAVFTIDAFINNSALFKDDEPPGKIVLVIDESLGADAIVGYDGVVGDLTSLKKPDVKLVLTEDSPSETLGRLVCDELGLKRDCLVTKKGVEEVYDLAKSSPSEPRAFVLWEPYVTRLMKERPQARVIIDSANAKSRGYFVDVLVVQKTFLEQHRKDKVEPIVRAYLEALSLHRQKGLSDLVLADSKKLVDAKKLKDALTAEESQAVASKIRWRTFAENCAHFGLPVPGTAPEAESMKKMVEKINALLVKTLAISKDWRDREELFFDATVCKDLLAAKLPTDEPPIYQPVPGQKVDPLTFRRGSDAISEESAEILKGVAALMKKHPEYVLEVRGHMLNDTDADRDLAQKRGDAVSRWLRDTGGVPADKVKVTVTGKSAQDERAGVTITVMQSGS